MDVGQSTANTLYQQAVDGTFKMEAGAAHKCADIFVRFADETVEPQIEQAKNLHTLGGFGTFTSATELQKGFEGKAVKLTEALHDMKAAALQMAAAYMRAGNDLEAADQLHARSIDATMSGVEK
ncbi:hypothetical protein [Nocardia vermiculata]|uniref:Uncharacterized protein n=1 Tax=Nocardia vermiculata TaxID=257274 RepID=A0A846XYS1_9NOCA|nr:hypothetical protein [Nocardia vermiculata]NKY50521.1 hypothetical protein [Nocardia vermiculata]